MSFNYSTFTELAHAVTMPIAMGVICVAAAGNYGQEAKVIMARLKNVIDGLPRDNDIRLHFLELWECTAGGAGCPGEGIMTTYPRPTGSGWGPFAAPLVYGTHYPRSEPGRLALAELGDVEWRWRQDPAGLLYRIPADSDPQMGYGVWILTSR